MTMFKTDQKDIEQGESDDDGIHTDKSDDDKLQTQDELRDTYPRLFLVG